MNSNRSRYIPGGLLGVALGIGAALATPGVASADPSTDPYLWIDQLLGGLSVPAQTTTLDMQVSVDGADLFPTTGNTATATSDTGDIAIAIGNGAEANATGGSGDFAFADGANSTAEAGFIGDFDSAVVFGANSSAEAGFGSVFTLPGECISAFCDVDVPHDFDLAAAFGDMLNASATTGNFLTDILPSL
jgi:hypothetical protein